MWGHQDASGLIAGICVLDVGCGDDCKDPSVVTGCRGSHQGVLPGVEDLPEGGARCCDRTSQLRTTPSVAPGQQNLPSSSRLANMHARALEVRGLSPIGPVSPEHVSAPKNGSGNRLAYKRRQAFGSLVEVDRLRRHHDLDRPRRPR